MHVICHEQSESYFASIDLRLPVRSMLRFLIFNLCFRGYRVFRGYCRFWEFLTAIKRARTFDEIDSILDSYLSLFFLSNY